MNTLQLSNEDTLMLLKELNARCESLFNAYGKNAHAHLDHIVNALQEMVNENITVQAPIATQETNQVVASEPVVAPNPIGLPAEPVEPIAGTASDDSAQHNDLIAPQV
jgi:hypothetical protein